MYSAIHAVGLCKEFKGKFRAPAFLAVDNVSLEIAPGEAFGFIGPNGAGKSTTIKILTGILRPTHGTASLFGIPVDQPEARRGLGYVPENPSLYDYLTPLEILHMGLRLHGVALEQELKHCLTWLDRFELGAVANKTITSFSKGMMQRVALAQALCIQPRLLILDEPLSGLDPIGRRDVVEILSEYKRSGGTLFFTSHVLHDVERLADRFGLIHRGRLRAVRSPAELLGMHEMVEVRSIGRQEVSGMRSEFDGRWSATLPRAELWNLLMRIQAAGHEIQEVRTTLSLETAFMAVVNGKDSA
ncbi:MAG: ABC transporter ATP-binding protein [Rhodocyclales bacterium]|nr:ABC transporter ATP-binding protein [Rhodocyclales bacterium]